MVGVGVLVADAKGVRDGVGELVVVGVGVGVKLLVGVTLLV